MILETKHTMIWCQNNKIMSKRKQFINKIVKIVPELSKFNEMNLLNYFLLMADINIQYETAVYINEVLDSYKLISEEQRKTMSININKTTIYVCVDMLRVHFQIFVNFNVIRPFFLGSKLITIYCKWFKLNILSSY